MAFTVRSILSDSTIRGSGGSTASLNEAIALKGGGFVVVSTGSNGISSVHEHSIFDASGRQIGSTARLDDPNYPMTSSEVSVVALADGGYVITYRSYDGVCQRVFDANGTPGEARVIAGASAPLPDVVALPGGGYLVVEPSGSDDPGEIYQRFFDAAGRQIGSPTKVNETDLGGGSLRDVTVLADGRYVVTWVGKDGTDSTDIYQRIFDANGTPLSPETVVEPWPSSNEEVTALPGGGYVLTYAVDSTLYQRVFDGNGSPVGSRTVIDEGARFSDVFSTKDGYVVRWEEYQDGVFKEYQQAFDANGQPIGGKGPAIDEGVDGSLSEIVVRLEGGGQAVLWTSYDDKGVRQVVLGSESSPGLTAGADLAQGTDGDDVLSVTGGTLTQGDMLTGGQGNDVLHFASAGEFDLRAPKDIKSFEKVLGSDGNDVLIADNGRLSSFDQIDLGAGTDILKTDVNGFRFKDYWSPSFAGIEGLSVIDPSAVADDRFVADLNTLAFLQLLDLGAGRDTLVLSEYSYSDWGEVGAQGKSVVFNLTNKSLSGVEAVTVWDDEYSAKDVLIVDAAVLGSLSEIDLGRANYSFDEPTDVLQLVGGGTFDLSRCKLVSVEQISVVGSESATVKGTAAADWITGGSGADRLSGQRGSDKLSGGAGRDRLDGDGGSDKLTGGSGRDTFIFDAKLGRSNVDTVTDFRARDDSFWLDNAVFKKLGKGSLERPGKLKADAFREGSGAADREDRIIYDPSTGALSYDADGTGSAGAVKFAQLRKGLDLSSADFFVV